MQKMARALKVAANKEHGNNGGGDHLRIGELSARIFRVLHDLRADHQRNSILREYGRTCEKSFSFSFLFGNKSLRKDFSFSKSNQAVTGNLGYLCGMSSQTELGKMAREKPYIQFP
jgi:hypothetical protein